MADAAPPLTKKAKTLALMPPVEDEEEAEGSFELGDWV
jgi:hypothetical protein